MHTNTARAAAEYEAITTGERAVVLAAMRAIDTLEYRAALSLATAARRRARALRRGAAIN